MTDKPRPLNADLDRLSPEVIRAYAALSPNELADVLELPCVLRYEVHPLGPVADEEGIVVIPRARADEILQKAQARVTVDARLTLDDWERRHRSGVEGALKTRGYRLS